MNERTEREREKERKSLVVLNYGEFEQDLAKVVTKKMQTPTTKLD